MIGSLLFCNARPDAHAVDVTAAWTQSSSRPQRTVIRPDFHYFKRTVDSSLEWRSYRAQLHRLSSKLTVWVCVGSNLDGSYPTDATLRSYNSSSFKRMERSLSPAISIGRMELSAPGLRASTQTEVWIKSSILVQGCRPLVDSRSQDSSCNPMERSSLRVVSKQ